jgi:Predicted nucleic-acid-binding protein, contains PIN domain
MRRAYLDANIVLRYLTDEPWDMAQEAAALFAAAERGEVQLLLDELTVAEVVWVLASFYKLHREAIRDGLTSFLANEGIVMDDKRGVLLALTLYAKWNVDFVDALLSVHMQRTGVPDLVSFDKHFDRLPGVRRRTPGGILTQD